MRKMTITTLAAALIIGGACGTGSSVEESGTADTAAAPADTTAPAPQQVPVGKALTVRGNGSTAVWTLTKAEAKDSDQYGTEPTSGGKYVLIHVTTAVSQGREVYACGCDISIVAKSGKVYEQTFASFKSRPDYTAATVAAGQNTDGWLIFDVASADLKGARVQLKQTQLFDDTAFGYWTLAL